MKQRIAPLNAPNGAGVTQPTNELNGTPLPRTSILAAEPLLTLIKQMNTDLSTLAQYGRTGDAYSSLRAATEAVVSAVRFAASLEVEIDVTEAAESTGLTPAAIRSHIRAHALPARRVGKRLYRIKLSDLRAWSEPRQTP